MDQDTLIRQFVEIENKIDNLIKTCKRLEAENTRLEQEKNDLNQQLQEKISMEKENEELKGLIRSKIDSLMGRLDEVTEE